MKQFFILSFILLTGLTVNAQYLGGSGKGDTTITILNVSFDDGSPVVLGGSGRGETMAGLYLNTLPVLLSSFTGKAQNLNAELTWVSVSEKNVSRYEVEKSTNKRTFSFVGSVAAAGTSNNDITYSFTDYQAGDAQSVVYYRLKMIDMDGNYKYSNVVSVKFQQKKIVIQSITPNPVTSESFSAMVTLPDNTVPAIITIYSSNGTALYTEQVIAKSTYQWTYRGEALSAGLYVFELRQGTNIGRMKFVVQ